MDPRTAKPGIPDATIKPTAGKPDESSQHEHLDKELDEELDDTFPASDPIPWSHEVK
jgi:hypothetical protein